jgi:hypothetical protein
MNGWLVLPDPHRDVCSPRRHNRQHTVELMGVTLLQLYYTPVPFVGSASYKHNIRRRNQSVDHKPHTAPRGNEGNHARRLCKPRIILMKTHCIGRKRTLDFIAVLNPLTSSIFTWVFGGKMAADVSEGASVSVRANSCSCASMIRLS